MSDNKNTGRSIYGKGYYIALILCAAAVGITSYWYHTRTNQEEAMQEAEMETVISSEGDHRDVAVIATQPQAQEQAPAAAEATEATEKRTLQTMSPVAGQEIFGYAMETLSYNETTRDWRTHNGIDLAAEAGTEVVAAADGEVYTTYEDETLGYTVVIRHEGGYTTRYSSLSEDLAVKAGDTVAMGDVIGTVDSTALVETVLGPHVHFSVSWQDTPMDPAEFLSLG